MSDMPESQSGMDASNLLEMIPQLRGRGNPTPKQKSSDSNNQAQMQMLINKISQMSGMPEAQSGMDASNLLEMILQVGGQGNPTPKQKSSDSNNQAQMLINQMAQMSAMPEAQSGMDASNLLKIILQLTGQGNPTPKKKSSDSNNQAQMQLLMNQISQMNALQQPQTGENPMTTLEMMTQLQALQGVKGRNTAPAQKGNVGVGINDLVAALRGTRGRRDGSCIWVAGLPEEYRDHQKLVNIFGCFGNVRHTVHSTKRPDGFIIEMEDARSARKARFVTRYQVVGGRPLKVIQLDPERFNRLGLDSRSIDVSRKDWRYAKDSKYRKIHMARLLRLTPKIIVYNIPEGKEDLLKDHIIDAGYTIKSMKGPQKKSPAKYEFTMQVIELASTEEAIGAVANLHNTWPKKMGNKRKDRFDRECGLDFSFAGILRAEREKRKGWLQKK